MITEAATTLLDLAGQDTRLFRVSGREWHGSCPLCGGRDRFRVQADQAGEHFACRKCGVAGDTAGYLAKVRHLSWQEAFSAVGRERDWLPPAPRPAPPAREPPPEWRECAARVVDACEAALWTPAGDRARAWLHARGLRDGTLRAWRIGYCAPERHLRIAGDVRPGREIAGLRVAGGIVIPWIRSGQVDFLQVRRPVRPGENPKYLAVAGGQRVLYGADALERTVGILVEGELDAMLLAQEAGDLIGTGTLGSCAASFPARAARYLLPLRRIILAYDADAAGQEGARRLLGRFPSFEGAELPAGPWKDITEYHLAGGSLREWVRGVVEVAS